jgi:solute carrier family 25 phosphate transporter 23/24/25/41
LAFRKWFLTEASHIAAYEAFKGYLTTEDHEPGTILKLICGGLAGSLSQTVRLALAVTVFNA